jgi:hypothetical protein
LRTTPSATCTTKIPWSALTAFDGMDDEGGSDFLDY